MKKAGKKAEDEKIGDQQIIASSFRPGEDEMDSVEDESVGIL